MSDQREQELRMLRQACPPTWTRWAERCGSETLQRSLRDGYPFASLLRLELLELFCPRIEGAQRLHDLEGTGLRVEIGEERAPNELSYRMLDAVHRNATAAQRGPGAPAQTELTLLRLRRAKLTVRDSGAIAHASVAGVEVSCGLMSLTGGFLWGRSDGE